MLHIAQKLDLPLDAVTQTLAAIARKGAGKTYLASLLAEQMLDAGAQVIVVDPVGNWWSIRVGADGRSKGKEIFIIGGEHGDIPLVPEAGARIAKLLVDKPVSAILDISEMRKGERLRFLTDFGEEFFHLKKRQRSPVHLFLEEAQLLLPQRFGSDQARLQGAWTDIVRLGRNYGIGETMISQRPQSIDKEVLNMTECLFVLQVNGVQERKALEDWVQEKGADRKLIGELPGLSRGEGFVWSPSWLRIFQRVKFAHKTTFDGSATPEVGKALKSATLTEMDVEKLRADLQEVVAQAEKDDPKALRRRIVELERELKSHPTAAPEKVVEEKLVEVPVLTDKHFDLVKELVARAEAVTAGLGDELRIVAAHLESLQESQSKVRSGFNARRLNTAPSITRKIPENYSRKVPHKPAPDGISNAQLKILSRLAELLEATGVQSVPKEQLAAWSEYSPTGGGYNNYLSALRTLGFIDYPSSGMVSITTDGASIAQPENAPATGEEMLQRSERVLGGSEARLLRAIAQAWPDSLTKEELAERTEFSPNGGGFNNYISHMRTLGFIDYPQRGQVRAADWLFPEVRQ